MADPTDDDRKEAVKIAVDMVKTLLTFSAGALALLVTFFRADIYKPLDPGHQRVVLAAGMLLMASIAAGVVALSRIYKRIEGRLPAWHGKHWSTGGAVAGWINLQVWAGVLGIAALALCLVLIGTPKSG